MPSIHDKILKKRKYNGNKSYPSYIKNATPVLFMMKSISPVEIEDIKVLDQTVYPYQ